MPLEDEIESLHDETFEVLSFFCDQISRCNNAREFLTDLVKSHADDSDQYNEEDEFDEVVNAFRREIDARFPQGILEPPFSGLLSRSLDHVNWRLIARYLMLELALDNLRSPSKESTRTSLPGVEFKKDSNKGVSEEYSRAQHVRYALSFTRYVQRRTRPEYLAEAMTAILDYLWQDEVRDYLAKSREERQGHIFSHLVIIRQWLASRRNHEDPDIEHAKATADADWKRTQDYPVPKGDGEET
jgi:hypothetical protein